VVTQVVTLNQPPPAIATLTWSKSTMFEFNTSRFQISHGHAPKGRGSWCFAVRELGDGREFFSPSMTYGEAKAWIRNTVRPLIPADYIGTVTITVLP
jgi:hypothetical protein